MGFQEGSGRLDSQNWVGETQEIDWMVAKGPSTPDFPPHFRLHPVPGPGFRAGLGPVLAGELVWTDQIPAPNCPGIRPGQFGIGFGPVHIGFPAKPAQNGPGNPARA